MKGNQKDSSEKLIWDQMRSPSGNTPHAISSSSSSTRALPKLMVWLIIFISVTYVVYTLKLVSTSRSCYTENPFDNKNHLSSSSSSSLDSSSLPLSSSSFVSNISISQNQTSIQEKTQTQIQIQTTSLEEKEEVEKKVISEKTGLQHIVFGIAASASLWEQRKNYIKLWWKPKEMRGIVWLDKSVKTQGEEEKKILPPLKISADTSQFAYKNRQGHRSAIRISRIVSETFRLGLKNVRWFVMGDDDTVFVADNLVRVLSKYDHTQYYYIGSLSESHLQNIYFSYDDRMQACMAELGVPLTKELGFHQYDVYGNLFGLLSAHPVTPLVTLHHLDVVEPIFPNVTRVQALQRLTVPMKLDSAGLMQQSICYDKDRIWTISVSWGFAVQIIRGVFSPREMEMPSRTFLNWYRRADYTAYAFNTRPVSRNHCQKPYVFYMSMAKNDSSSNQTVSEYVRHRVPHPACKWKMADPAVIERIQVYKKPDPHLWDRSPRRNCCKVQPSKKKNSMVIDVGVCREGEISEM
ncbi:hypothetical protein AQUCO_01300235v1 [Aquilegia coerulea]|uniref:Uncharacterized protein n=1 Tax=Aquilegia coerulea TaxID=218851 RepID=A0A2G5E0D8_AQUCA|nr:hypothetical protein AQUCO_01300235v1 [Aquilegia coerulea]